MTQIVERFISTCKIMLVEVVTYILKRICGTRHGAQHHYIPATFGYELRNILDALCGAY